jgi:hypothetical protein
MRHSRAQEQSFEEDYMSTAVSQRISHAIPNVGYVMIGESYREVGSDAPLAQLRRIKESLTFA